MPVHCLLQLTGSRAALPRVVSVLHARGLTVEHLHLDGTRLCVAVRGAGPHRITGVLERLADVVAVHLGASCDERPALPTRYLVWREELPAAG
jgi:hypothetical protein